MSECNHNCSSCSSDCKDRKAESTFKKTHELSSVKKVIGVISGKGGVGKSLVTGLLAVLANQRGKEVAIMDADITGPSIPKMFGVKGPAAGSELGLLPEETDKGIRIMSANLLLQHEDDPVLWRGPLISGMVTQFWTDVIWGNVDIMFIDMPPGTGDVALTTFQSIKVDGIIIVSSPQELVGMIVSKAVKMANMMNIPVLGLVENMSYVQCPHCNEKIEVFGHSNVDAVAKEFGLKVLARIPIDPNMANACDKGQIESLKFDYLDDIMDTLI